MGKENPNSSLKLPMKEISRRNFLCGMASVGAAYVGRGLFPQEGILAEPTPTPELPKLLERIKVDIPGLTVEKYAVKFQDITDEVPESDRRDIEEWVAQPEFHLADDNSRDHSPKESLERVWDRLWPVKGQCGLSFVSLDQIRPNHDRETFYYDGNEGRFFTNVLGFYDKVLEDDLQMLNQKNAGSWYTQLNDDVSQPRENSISMSSLSRKILYRLLLRDQPASTMVAIIADISHGTKTLIKGSQLGSSYLRLTHDGNKLLLSLPNAEAGMERKIYLLDLNSGQTQFQSSLRREPYDYQMFLNEDGSKLYFNSTGYIHNTLTGEKKLVSWPRFLTPFWASASPDLNFIVRGLGMFSASRWVEGQWGIMAYTTDGFLMIDSPDWSWPPHKVDNDGTIYTNRSDIFKFEDGTYKLVKAGLAAQFKVEKDGKPIEVQVRRVG